MKLFRGILRAGILSVSRLNSAFCISLNFGSSLIDSIGGIFIKRCFFHCTSQIARICIVCFNCTSMRISYFKLTTCAHIGLLCVIFSLSAVSHASQIPPEPRACPAYESDDGWVPCSKIMKYIEKKSLDLDKQAAKLAVKK